MQLEKQEDSERKTTMDIAADMTRQFKSMQEELSNKINSLESLVSDNDETLKSLREEYERLN